MPDAKMPACCRTFRPRSQEAEAADAKPRRRSKQRAKAAARQAARRKPAKQAAAPKQDATAKQ
jgi:hypothetical protein